MLRRRSWAVALSVLVVEVHCQDYDGASNYNGFHQYGVQAKTTGESGLAGFPAYSGNAYAEHETGYHAEHTYAEHAYAEPGYSAHPYAEHEGYGQGQGYGYGQGSSQGYGQDHMGEGRLHVSDSGVHNLYAPSTYSDDRRYSDDYHLRDVIPQQELGQHVCDGHEQEWANCGDQPACEDCVPVDCLFTEWSMWWPGGGCVGLKFRHRSVQVANNKCGLPCYGNKIESEPYDQPECNNVVRDCLLSSWEEWGACRDEMDQSVRSRKVDQNPTAGGRPCKGVLAETRPCGGPNPEPCIFSAWHMWTTCSATCGEGRHTRMRRVASEDRLDGQTCDDSLLETQMCKMEACTSRDCMMGYWSEWSGCGTIGEFHEQRTRHRQILQSPEGDGQDCEKVLMETGACPSKGPEDCELSMWAEWSQCDKTCHGGQKYRKRKLLHPNVRGGHCHDSALSETGPCNTEPCNDARADCQLSGWGKWGECSEQEGPGEMTRTRTVLSPARGDGDACTGSMEELKTCIVKPAQVLDCMWSDWQGWSACSASCNGGVMHRFRAISMAPQNGGRACEPLEKEAVAPCNTNQCGSTCEDGKYGEWMDWTDCSATCSSGYRTRRRVVDVLPNACGSMSQGVREAFEVCADLPPCIKDVDCELSTWGDWSHCSDICFGVRERNRHITAFARGNGRLCDQDSLKTVAPCNPLPGSDAPEQCQAVPAVNCMLSEWEAWEQCSATCGGGQEVRKRRVEQPSSSGGLPCSDQLTVTRGCATQSCEPTVVQDCIWSTWSSWGDCSHCGGQRWRHRTIEQLPNAEGRLCVDQSAKEVSNCSSTCYEEKYCAWSEWSSPQCSGQCGSTTTMRNRAMHLVDASSDFLFLGEKHSSCLGSQLDVAMCPFNQACKEECVPRACAFGVWSDWNEPTCVGLCERKRVIAQMNNECGAPCAGPLDETKRCETECGKPINCVMSEWTAWSHCANITQIGMVGQRYRKREVLEKPHNGGNACGGDLVETKACDQEMPEPCIFSTWHSWTMCSAQCGEGKHTRVRHILQASDDGGRQCRGALEEIASCRVWDAARCEVEQDCEFGSWAEWGSCGFSMQRERNRVLSKRAQLGGLPCLGPVHETETCHRAKVDCDMSAWTAWDECSRTCGAGQTRRQRQIQKFPAHGGSLCPPDLVETKGCNVGECTVRDCQISGWLEWSGCSVSCGPGHQTRARTVTSLREAGGYGCFFALAENRACGNPDCDLDCKWNDWGSWSGCTKSCGGGTMMRQRGIAQMPKGAGAVCDEHEMKELLPCNLGECNHVCVDGLWGDWENWAPCSASCQGGETWRRRHIIRAANNCGTPAQGDSRQVKFCEVETPCHPDKDCLFTAWNEWNVCSASCNGVAMRHRSVAQYGHGQGLFCVGGLVEITPCNPGEGKEPPAGCVRGPPVDCILSEWQGWASCSATCNGGETSRQRFVIQHPQHGGFGCKAPLSEVKECARDSCGGPKMLDCVLGDWNEWESCGRCNGERKRYRHILVYPANGGRECPPADEVQVGVCPHNCDTEVTCSWAGWDSWGSCTASCGTGGRRKRIRHLTAQTVQIEEAEPDMHLLKRYETLYARTKDLEVNHSQEVMLAFVAGCLSLATLGVVLRRSGSAYVAAGETELPLVQDSL